MNSVENPGQVPWKHNSCLRVASSTSVWPGIGKIKSPSGVYYGAVKQPCTLSQTVRGLELNSLYWFTLSWRYALNSTETQQPVKFKVKVDGSVIADYTYTPDASMYGCQNSNDTSSECYIQDQYLKTSSSKFVLLVDPSKNKPRLTYDNLSPFPRFNSTNRNSVDLSVTITPTNSQNILFDAIVLKFADN